MIVSYIVSLVEDIYPEISNQVPVDRSRRQPTSRQRITAAAVSQEKVKVNRQRDSLLFRRHSNWLLSISWLATTNLSFSTLMPYHHHMLLKKDPSVFYEFIRRLISFVIVFAIDFKCQIYSTYFQQKNEILIFHKSTFSCHIRLKFVFSMGRINYLMHSTADSKQ